ncbi:hypothetical protein GPECTOR_6g673 [Gonium pectorale]|uniref:Sucrose phosphatase-like domain-containing protein n=1 Tax=Gonium pectorale TaxID=33097 RepID=A0A150GV53_GONPE|nr:hypothetical protein GPECTOR_6g673 [Gonium pectorale]|eukprot:KXZ53756.1 hypothetical protein GPECTOR_6g673 [Gonium pectorale]
MVQNEDPTHRRLLTFNTVWHSAASHDSLLVYSTGRSPDLYHRLWVDSEQRRHKLSFHLERGGGGDSGAGANSREPQAVLRELQVVYSGGRDVDLLAEGAGKGAALAHLLGRLRDAGLAPTDGVQVNGDSGNDIELFTVPGVRGCVVANAYPELREFAARAVGAAKAAAIKAVEAGDCGGSQARECAVFEATEPCAGGILQALRHFWSLPPDCFHDAGASARHADDDAAGGAPGPSLPAQALVVAAAHMSQVADGAVAACGSVAAAAAATAAGGVWLDRVQVEAVRPEAVTGASRGSGGAPPPLDVPPVAAEGVAVGAWTVRCQAFKLLPNGHRDTGCMSAVDFAVHARSAEERAAAAVAGGMGAPDQAGSYQATRLRSVPIDMQDIVLPPVES